MRTRDQILEVATTLFADAGYEATSLDKVAENQSFSKQTIVYHFSSKEGLLEAVIDESVEKLIEAFERAASLSKGVEGVEAIVKAVFLMATRNPEILGILREVMRLGNEWNFKVREKLEPYMQRAQAFLEVEMKAGRIKKANSHFILLAVYSTVIGVATEVEFLRAMGIETSLKEAVVRRKDLLDFLSVALR